MANTIQNTESTRKQEYPIISDQRRCGVCLHFAETHIYYKGSLAYFQLPKEEQTPNSPEYPDALNLCYNCSQTQEIQQKYTPATFIFNAPSTFF